MPPSIPPASPPAIPAMNGLRLKNPPWDCPGIPGEDPLPGALNPGEGPEGVLGDEKLLLPLLPIEPPFPALAQALDSTKIKVEKSIMIDKATRERHL
ncbi:MAG: hypothetical protein AAGU11_07170 [Syntrophobacteraceae bacterium]